MEWAQSVGGTRWPVCKQVRRGSGVYLALRDEGACATVLSVRVYYVVCQPTTANLAVFPRTVAGPQVTSVVQVCRSTRLQFIGLRLYSLKSTETVSS